MINCNNLFIQYIINHILLLCKMTYQINIGKRDGLINFASIETAVKLTLSTNRNNSVWTNFVKMQVTGQIIIQTCKATVVLIR